MEALQTNLTYQESRQNLVALIHQIHAKGWSPATSTNYSFRNPEPYQQTYTISSSGVDKSAFTDKHLMVVDSTGSPIPEYEHLRPSAETLLHTQLYAQFPEVGAVLHTHSMAATVLSHHYRFDNGFWLRDWEVLKGLRGIETHTASVWLPVFANDQDIARLSQLIAQYQPQTQPFWGYLLAGHGLYAWGKDLAEAKRHLETFEFLMACKLALMHIEE